MIEAGSKGLAWIKIEANNEFVSPIAKFLTDEEKASLLSKTGAREGSSIFLLAGKPEPTTKLSGILRNLLGEELNLCDPDKFEFCWITDFPMFELDDENQIQYSYRSCIGGIEYRA